MLNTLISVNEDLSSRFAVWYMGQLREILDLSVHLIHVTEPEHRGRPVATGWVQKTWEDSVLLQTRTWIDRMIRAEKNHSRILDEPEIVSGDREEILLHSMNISACGLFVEGMFHSFKPDGFLTRIRSNLYKKAPCPILMVKNKTGLSRGVVIACEDKNLEKALDTFFCIFEPSDIRPDILICRLDGPAEDADRISRRIERIDTAFAQRKKKHGDVKTMAGDVAAGLPFVRNCSLVVSPFPEKESFLENLLSLSPCPLLLGVQGPVNR